MIKSLINLTRTHHLARYLVQKYDFSRIIIIIFKEGQLVEKFYEITRTPNHRYQLVF